MKFLSAFCVALLLSSSASAISSYRLRIPNGTVNSCITCHDRSTGGEGWNEFGEDILEQDPDVDLEANPTNENLGFDQLPVWDTALCNLRFRR